MTNEELVQKIQDGQTELMLDLWLQVKGFICKIADSFSEIRFKNRCALVGLTKEDLISEGYFVLYSAVKNYKPDQSSSFINYLARCLNNKFYILLGMYASGRKWYDHADVLSKSISIDKTVFEDKDGSTTTVENYIPDKSAEEKMQAIENADYIENLHSDLEIAMNSLRPREAQVIKNYYYNDISLSRQAESFNCSVSTITQIKNEALFSLRRHKALQVYRDELIDTMAYHTGLDNFKNTRTSATERIVLKLDAYERELKEYERKLSKVINT